MIKGNKGEWSEIYVLLKLLAEGNLYPGDKDLNRIKDAYYPIVKILRTESFGDMEYFYDQDIVLITGREELARMTVKDFKEKSLVLFDRLKEKTKGTFSVPEIEEFMRSIHCANLKASSSVKTDITVKVHDHRTGFQPILGFSIKSQLGGASTLLNAGKTTNFKYKINGLNGSELDQINSISNPKKILKRISKISELGGTFEFDKIINNVFSNNLVLIDSLLPQIISEIILNFYTTSASTLTDLVELSESKNPLGFDNSNKHLFYTYKVKKMLTDIALGMTPAKVWSGKYDATGGYLIVKDDGDILCYHLYNKNEFEDYLLSNTRLETASTTRYSFAELYEENGQFFFNLNLQIRFIK